MEDTSALRKLLDRDEFKFSENLDRKTEGLVFDKRTIDAIFQVFKEFSIRSLDFPISSGKEALVFKVIGNKGPLVMKIFKMSTLKFSNIQKYIDGDPRFKNYRKTRGNIVYLWTRKEFSNLSLCEDNGIRTPRPYGFKENILLMSYVGTKVSPAPKLKDVTELKREKYLTDAMLQYRSMVEKAHIVHADFSEYNILCHMGRSYVIDLGQAVSNEHPMAAEFLKRDIDNMRNYCERNRIEFREDWVPELRRNDEDE
ncbi:MAG: serine protein kinase RIO [Candidatus Thermoplasmatota archaeon]|nr:serine protein kinase RIO [Candidatus Thermoplasmatota archaeon]MCL5791304.1 serine protein kinase RIO [Candidatus Thermoplasmatota archaeon]